MIENLPSKLTWTMGIMALAIAVAGCDVTAAINGMAVKGTFQKTLTVTGAVDLTVQAGSGSITIQPGAGGEIKVTGHIRARESWRSRGVTAEEKVKRLEQRPPVEQTGNTITVGEITDADLRDNVSITYEIVAPSSTRIRSRAGSGSMQIGDFAGPVEATDGSGSIKIGKIAERVSATTGSGSIRIDGSGPLHVETGSGSIHVAAANGSIEATAGSGSIDLGQTGPGLVDVSTGSGGITIRGARGRVKASTGSGSITADGTVADDWHLNTSSGTVTLTVPATASFDLDARTSSGSVESDHPITMVGSIDRRHLLGKVRGGGPRLELRTSSGSIRIR
ncbi:MAG: DUF4097 family beta strand repeat protein [Acidobacteria bacterium]|nr:DUF4097 family beta strand repeat protein [Acidobacteriota bacterium]